MALGEQGYKKDQLRKCCGPPLTCDTQQHKAELCSGTRSQAWLSCSHGMPRWKPMWSHPHTSDPLMVTESLGLEMTVDRCLILAKGQHPGRTRWAPHGLLSPRFTSYTAPIFPSAISAVTDTACQGLDRQRPHLLMGGRSNNLCPCLNWLQELQCPV